MSPPPSPPFTPPPPGGAPPPGPAGAAGAFTAAPRPLRRSATDRVGAGVAGGLGEYLGVDPVLFRVLFAVSAFFGGAGAIAYAVLWAVVPVEGTGHAPVDSWVDGLRRRHVPPWLLAVVGGVVLWGIAFSWWFRDPPWPLFAVIVVAFVVVVGTRSGGWRRPPPAAPPVPPGAPGPQEAPAVSLDDEPSAASPPSWVLGTRAWFSEARDAARARRRRAFPLRVAGGVALVLALTVLGVIDGIVGIWLPVYFWVVGGIALVTLLFGTVLRRAPWSLAQPLVLAIIGAAAFGGTHASLHDGIGQQVHRPGAPGDLRDDYRLAFGQEVLDLRGLTPDAPRDIDVTLAAGQVQVLLPDAMNATVQAEVHRGLVEADDRSATEPGSRHRGIGDVRTVQPPAGAVGPAVTVHVDVAAGVITVRHGD